ncbi:hypothetical protein H0266_02140 [Halobacillus locisalis]|uniref:SecDF P1 head subdomain domain-containing protein n=1 Tax=Halobacillus locisalis TaxID=220753 RepID=A0A838CPC2_9BACI|nr:hypothetical protein [Halobacillus locisalis]MBA2173689.1 hypothetical protein [Halobacillus locisalis]
MKFAVSAIMALLVMVGCQNSAQSFEEVSLKNEQGEVLATAEDFAGASLNEREGDTLITVKFEDESKAKELTERHLGETISVYLSEEVVSSPAIQTVIDSRSLEINGDYTKEEAELFVDSVNQ